MRMKNKLRSRKGIALWSGAAIALLLICLLVILFSGEGEAFPVYISEIVASNTGSPNADGRCVDFIEIHNGGNYAVDLTGYQLGDIAGSLRYAFPAGTVIQPNQYLVVWCDKEVDGYAPFGISRSGGEMFYLIASNNAIVDQVTTIGSDMDQAMIRSERGEWELSDRMSPGSDDAGDVRDIYNENISSVRITEVSAAGSAYYAPEGVFCDWVELYNGGSENINLAHHHV